MANLPAEAWVTIGCIGGFVILGMLHTLARKVENETRRRETYAKAARLRADYEEAQEKDAPGTARNPILVDEAAIERAAA
jgi:hypothetical protein